MEQRVQTGELARTVGYLVALTIEKTPAKDLAAQLHSTPGALYKTPHGARRKLRAKLERLPIPTSSSASPVVAPSSAAIA